MHVTTDTNEGILRLHLKKGTNTDHINDISLVHVLCRHNSVHYICRALHRELICAAMTSHETAKTLHLST